MPSWRDEAGAGREESRRRRASALLTPPHKVRVVHVVHVTDMYMSHVLQVPLHSQIVDAAAQLSLGGGGGKRLISEMPAPDWPRGSRRRLLIG